MFAIETIVENSLYAIRYEDIEDDKFENNEIEEEHSRKDEFRRLFANWSNPEYLDAFFAKHKSDLQKELFNFISIEDELYKLESVKQYLKDEGIIDDDSIIDFLEL